MMCIYTHINIINSKSAITDGYGHSLRTYVNAALASLASGLPLPDNYLKNLMAYQEPDGTFRTKEGKKSQATVLTASHAYYLLSQLKSNGELKQYVSKMNEGFNNLLSELESSDDLTLSFGEKLQLQTTSRILIGYFSLPLNNEDVTITSSQILQITKFLLDSKDSSSIEDAYFVYAGLKAIEQNPKGKPIILSLVSPNIKDNGNGQATINIKSIWDEEIKGVNVNLKQSIVGEDEVLSNVNGEKKGNNVIIPVFKDGKPGSYELKLQVEAPKSYLSVDSYILHCNVITTLNINNLKVSLSSGSQYKAPEYPKKITEAISVDPSTTISISFDIKDSTGNDFQPQQVFIQFIHNSGEVQYTTVATIKKSQYVSTINLKETSVLNEGFRYKSGDYKCILLIGDTSIQDSIQWEFGNFQITLPAAPSKELPLYHRPLLYESDTTLKPLPVFDHIFRAPDNRANPMLAILFTVFVIAPVGFYVLYLMYMKTTFGGFVWSGIIWAAGFHGTLGVILYLFVQYWINLTMFTVLGYLCPLLTILAFFGYRLFSTLDSSSKGVEHAKKD